MKKNWLANKVARQQNPLFKGNEMDIKTKPVKNQENLFSHQIYKCLYPKTSATTPNFVLLILFNNKRSFKQL